MGTQLDVLTAQAESESRPRRWWAIAGVAILGMSGVAGWQIWQVQRQQAREQPAESSLVSEISTVTALGRLEPEGETIQLTAPTSTQESRIEQLLVDVGDRVEAGEVIAILDNRDRLQAALQQATEQVSIAQAQLAQVQAGAKTGELQAQEAEIARLQADQVAKLEAQRATINRLEAEVRNAQAEYQRYQSLYQQGAVSASRRDAEELTYTTAQQRLTEARAELARIQTTSQQQIQQAIATLDQLAEVRPVDIAAAEAQVAAAIAAVAEAEANLAQTRVRSPQAGQIIDIHTRPGEIIGSEGVATLGETDDMRAIAEVYQTDIAKITVGQPATITSPAIPGELHGTVERIGLQVQQQEVVDEDPAANIDAKVVEVWVDLEPESSDRVENLTNLQVTVTIHTDEH